MDEKKADLKASPNDYQADNNTPDQYHITSVRELDVILAIAHSMTPEFYAVGDLRRLDITGTDALRHQTRQKNPLQRICNLRKINGMDCITTVRVPDARDGKYGNAPGYYLLTVEQLQRWDAVVSRKAGG
jgi:hypothetical protein